LVIIMIAVVLLSFLSVCLGAILPLPLNSKLINGTVDGYSSVSYTVDANNYYSFELNLWRTSSFAYGKAPTLSMTVIDPSGVNYDFNGQKTFYPNTFYKGNYTINIYNSYSSSKVAYQIRACVTYCPASCTYSSISGYCYNNGACIGGACKCDTSNSTTLTSSCSTYIDILPVVQALSTLWITVIVIVVIVVIVIPTIIIAACCGCCGLCCAACFSNGGQNRSVVHHYHGQPPVPHAQPVAFPPTGGVQYIQVQN